MAKVRYAVVGAGWISQEAFLPAVAQTGNSEVAAIVSGSADKARRLAEFHGVKTVCGYEGFDALAASGALDAVYIATPNSSHAAWAERAAGHGLHLLVEKPLATSEAESLAMVRAAGRAGVYLATAYRLHNDPGTHRVMELLREGAIGDPRVFSSSFGFQIAAGNHRLDSGHWGGPLQDLGVYCVNAVRHVFGGEPLAAQATVSNDAADPRFATVAAGIAATLRFDRGRVATFHVGFGNADIDEFTVLGTTGTLALRRAYLFSAGRTIELTRGGRTERIDVPHTDNFSGMVACFSDCILAGTPPAVGPSEGLADMRALLAIEAAAASGGTVPVTPTAGFAPLQPAMRRSFPPVTHRLVLD